VGHPVSSVKQAPKAWYYRIDAHLQKLGFEKSEADPNLYFIVVGEDPLILFQYVDDLFITGAERLITSCKESLASEFEMTDIELMHHFFGIGGLSGAWTHLPGTREVCL
jgi:hypothetical protein